MLYDPRPLVLMIACVPLMACSDRSTIASIPSPKGWTSVNIAGHATLQIPPELNARSVRGVDSFVLQYHSETMDINIDYGLYSDPLNDEGKIDFVERSTKIGGREARIVTYEQQHDPPAQPYVAAIHFQRVGPGKNALTIWTASQTPKDRAVAQNIFRTISFR